MRKLKVLLTASVLVLGGLSEASAANWQTVYETDFSSGPGWTTNSPTTHYWDSESYFVDQINVNYGGYYAYYDAGYDGNSFKLEWDFIVEGAAGPSGLNFGLSNSDLDIDSDTYVRLILHNNRRSYLNWWGTNGYGSIETTILWSYGIWYQATLEYNGDAGTIMVNVRERNTQVLLYFISAFGVGSFTSDMGLIATTNYRPNNDFSVPGSHTWGRFDNVEYFSYGPNPITLDLTDDPLYVFHAFSLTPVIETAYITGFGSEYSADDVDLTSIRLNETIVPTGVSIIGEGELEIQFLLRDLIDPMLPLWDTTVQQVEVTGMFLDGMGFVGQDNVTVIGRNSMSPRREYLKPDDADMIASTSETLPNDFSLHQNYPNPFNPATEISFSLPNAGEVRLEVFNVMGQQVATLVNGPMAAGSHTVTWDSRDDAGHKVSGGVYFYRLEASEFVETRKMVLLK